MGDENPIHTLGDYSKPSHKGYRNTIELPVGNNVVPLRSDTIQLMQNGCSFHRLWSEDPNQHLKDFLKLVDSLDLDGENRERTRMRLFQIFFCDQASNWLERLPAGSITTWEDLTTRFLAQFFPPGRTAKLRNDILMSKFFYDNVNLVTRRTIDQSAGGKLRDQNGKESWRLLEDLALYDDERALPRYMVKNPKLSTSLVFSAHSYPNMDPQCSNHIHSSINAVTIYPEQQSDSYDDRAKENEEEEKDNPENIHANPSTPPDPSVICKKEDDREVMFFESIRKNDDSSQEEPEEEGSTTTEGEPIITEGCPSNHKIPCNIGYVHVERAYIDPNSPLNILTRMMYNWIMRRKLDPTKDTNRGVSNFIGRIKRMHVFVGNFTYVIDFMIVEDISSIIDPRLSQVVLGRPFVEISNITHDPLEGLVRFTNRNDEVAYKMPHKIEQYNSLSNLEKEHTKSVYLGNEEDKRRGVEYVMSKILGFYKECLELRPEYLTGMDDEGKFT
ncbi:retrotransposon ORF1 [Tanacetum coccineum]